MLPPRLASTPPATESAIDTVHLEREREMERRLILMRGKGTTNAQFSSKGPLLQYELELVRKRCMCVCVWDRQGDKEREVDFIACLQSFFAVCLSNQWLLSVILFSATVLSPVTCWWFPECWRSYIIHQITLHKSFILIQPLTLHSSPWLLSQDYITLDFSSSEQRN